MAFVTSYDIPRFELLAFIGIQKRPLEVGAATICLVHNTGCAKPVGFGIQNSSFPQVDQSHTKFCHISIASYRVLVGLFALAGTVIFCASGILKIRRFAYARVKPSLVPSYEFHKVSFLGFHLEVVGYATGFIDVTKEGTNSFKVRILLRWVICLL